MERMTVKVDAEGRIELPASIPAALGLVSGDQVEVRIDGNGLTLSPKRPSISAEEAERLITELQAMFAGQPSLEDDFYEMRREEEKHSKRMYGC